MKRIAKRALGFCTVCFMIPMFLVGCGTAQEEIQPAEHLQRVVDALATGDVETLKSMTGADELFTGAGDAKEAAFIEQLWRTILKNVKVTCTLKESDGSTAVVAVRGKTGNLSSITEKVFNDIAAEGRPWMKEYTDKGLTPTQEEVKGKLMELTQGNFEEYAGQMEIEDVDMEITMRKQANGYWWVSRENTKEMQYLFFGSTDLQNDPGLRELGLDLHFTFNG